MATQPIIQGQTTPVFAPDGSIRQIPDGSLRDAFAAGAKLAVQVKAPSGDVVYVPHDHVADALKAGGQINSEQGTKSEPHPQEGFWHSLGSVFGLTSEQLNAQAQQQKEHPITSSLESATPGYSLVKNAFNTAPSLAKKAMAESDASYDSLKHGDVVSFLAHQLGGMGYVGATLASPLLGDSPAKAGEQLGEGNVRGALGTTTGVVAPIVVAGAVKSGKPAPIQAPNVYEGPPPVEIPTGRPINQPSLVNRAATAVANAKLPPGVNLIPKAVGAQKLAQMIAKVTAPAEVSEVPTYGNVANAEARGPYQPYQGDLTVTPEVRQLPTQRLPVQGESHTVQTFTPSTAEEIAANQQRIQQNIAARRQAIQAAAESKVQAVPTGEPPSSSPSTIPRTNSGEGVLTQALTALDNKNLIKIAKSRGIDVSKEVQLKPGAANGTIIKKIIDDFSPDELEEVRNMGLEVSRNKPVQAEGVSPDDAAEAWHYKVLNTFFPDVNVPKTMAARAQATIAQRPLSPREQAFRAQAEAKANATPIDETQGGHAGNGVSSVEELSRPGTNYVVSKSGQVTYHGKSFAPESTPAGSTHVTAMPDGSLRVNAGPKLSAQQESALNTSVQKPQFQGEAKVPASDAEMEDILQEMMRQMKSNKAKSKSAGQ